MTNWVYGFGFEATENHEIDRNRLGDKGAGLAEMARMGLPVPPGITIIADVCRYFYDNGNSFPEGAEGGGRGGTAKG